VSGPDKLFLQECNFAAGAAGIDNLPSATLPEIAFAGRSNVGKSSLINALLNRKSLARVSQSPGCTSQINFYNLADRLMLADLPGYGYARKSKATLQGWDALISHYLKGRPTLQRVCVLVDSRRGVGEADEVLMEMLDEAAVVYQIVFTKMDAVNKTELEKLQTDSEKLFKKHQALHPILRFTSSDKKLGLEELQQELIAFAKKA
jgi:GTP-binding protein